MSILDAIDFLRFCSEVFCAPNMALPDSGAVGADAILRHIDAEADSVGIEVTLYLT
jgi:hypothetical protein